MDSARLVALFALYLVAGLFTLRFLKKRGLRVAYVVYLIAFVALFTYIPYMTGSCLMYRFLCWFMHERAVTILEHKLIYPVAASLPYFSVSFVVAILLSLFLCASLAVLAVSLLRIVCRRLKRLFDEPAGKRRTSSLRTAGSLAPERPARYRFCRLNC